ncbi:hypothetical protein ABZ817_42085 [Streptomyces antimycoticus]|uniref:hypothetical protein n=1 Tax=Streptomyces antimycoticus TaxID=68175 RepID=UPI0033CD0ED6
MTEPPFTSYDLPDARTLYRARVAAYRTRAEAPDRLARVMCAHLAAAVCDILTGSTFRGPFDARWLEMTLHPSGGVVVSGRYWTHAGECRDLADAGDTFGMGEWADELGAWNRDGWSPLCTATDVGHDGTITYRLDLARAAETARGSCRA